MKDRLELKTILNTLKKDKMFYNKYKTQFDRAEKIIAEKDKERKKQRFEIWKIDYKTRKAEKITKKQFGSNWKKEHKVDDDFIKHFIRFKVKKLDIIPQVYIHKDFSDIRFLTVNDKECIYYFGYGLRKEFFESLKNERSK